MAVLDGSTIVVSGRVRELERDPSSGGTLGPDFAHAFRTVVRVEALKKRRFESNVQYLHNNSQNFGKFVALCLQNNSEADVLHLERGTGSEVGVGRALHGLLEHQPEGPVRPVREEVHVVGGHQPTRPGVQELDGRAVLGGPVDGPVEAEPHHEDAAVNYEPKEKWGKVWKLSCRAS